MKIVTSKLLRAFQDTEGIQSPPTTWTSKRTKQRMLPGLGEAGLASEQADLAAPPVEPVVQTSKSNPAQSQFFEPSPEDSSKTLDLTKDLGLPQSGTPTQTQDEQQVQFDSSGEPITLAPRERGPAAHGAEDSLLYQALGDKGTPDTETINFDAAGEPIPRGLGDQADDLVDTEPEAAVAPVHSPVWQKWENQLNQLAAKPDGAKKIDGLRNLQNMAAQELPENERQAFIDHIRSMRESWGAAANQTAQSGQALDAAVQDSQKAPPANTAGVGQPPVTTPPVAQSPGDAGKEQAAQQTVTDAKAKARTSQEFWAAVQSDPNFQKNQNDPEYRAMVDAVVSQMEQNEQLAKRNQYSANLAQHMGIPVEEFQKQYGNVPPQASGSNGNGNAYNEPPMPRNQQQMRRPQVDRWGRPMMPAGGGRGMVPPQQTAEGQYYPDESYAYTPYMDPRMMNPQLLNHYYEPNPGQGTGWFGNLMQGLGRGSQDLWNWRKNYNLGRQQRKLPWDARAQDMSQQGTHPGSGVIGRPPGNRWSQAKTEVYNKLVKVASIGEQLEAAARWEEMNKAPILRALHGSAVHKVLLSSM